MARNPLGIFKKIFAKNGDKTEFYEFEEGWNPDYSDPTTDKRPQRVVMNDLFAKLFALGVDVNSYGGGLPWNQNIEYKTDATVTENGMLYLALRDNLNKPPSVSNLDWGMIALEHVGATPAGGFEGGISAFAGAGGAIGKNAITDSGGAVGEDAVSASGGAIGEGASATNGFAGGYKAKSTGDKAIQLGTGTNSEDGTLKVFDTELLKADGKIPNERTKGVSSSILTADGSVLKIENGLVTFMQKEVTIPPLLTPNGYQYFIENTGLRLMDRLGYVCEKPVVTNVPCVRFGNGDGHAKFKPTSLQISPFNNFILKARLVNTGITGRNDILTLDAGTVEVSFYISGDENIGAPNSSSTICFRLFDPASGEEMTGKGAIPDSFIDKMITATVKKTGSVWDFLVEGNSLQHTQVTDTWNKAVPIPDSPMLILKNRVNPITMKNLYMNLGGYEAEFMMEEGAGDVLYNLYDTGANAYLESTETNGVGIMRSARTNDAMSHNAKNGCRKVSGTEFSGVSDNEFVYIPADKNGVAQDSSMVEVIHLHVITTDEWYDLTADDVPSGIWHGGRMLYNEGGLGVSINFWKGQWYIDVTAMGDSYCFPVGSNDDNLYPPKGNFVVTDNCTGNSVEVEISYDYPSINDDGNIVAQNLTCMPAVMHNGANFTLTQKHSASPKPLWSVWYDEFGNELDLSLDDFKLLTNGTKDTASRFDKMGADNACHLLEQIVYKQGAVASMNDVQRQEMVWYMGSTDCAPKIPVT